MQEPSFWDDNNQAQKTIEECNELKAWTVPYREMMQSVDNVKALLPEVIELKDTEMLESLKEELAGCDKKLSLMEVRRMLSGEMDGKNCFLSINAGALVLPLNAS